MDDPKTPRRRRPASVVETGSGVGQKGPKPRRMTIEELVAGMTPDKQHPLEDDWPIGEELI
jgi:hypothetical protein